MSASLRFATMAFMMALSRTGLLPSCALKSRSCFCRYSGICPAIFGLAGATLLPSPPWQAAHTCAAIPCAVSWASAAPAATSAAASPPSAGASLVMHFIRSPIAKGAILLEFPAFAMSVFAHAAFLRAAGRGSDLPPPGPPEIAFAGRSNVGKSSAINALVGRRALARTSKTPGRTQTINFYALAEAGRLVDLPGYGYARVSQSMRAPWRELVGAYLHSATTLVGI